MKLSIIVCVYNTKKELLDKCLNSVYTSTLKDYEVLVVDDGSSVDYTEIIEKYGPVYVKTGNRGHLAARTYGLMLAKGEYVAYLDSDDTVSFNYHRPMLETAVEHGCDIVINDWAFKTASTVAYCTKDSLISNDFCLEGDEILKQYSSQRGKQHSYFVLWNKIFKKELLLSAKAEIEKTDAIMKKQTYAEDMLITFFAFKNAKKMKNIHTGYYFYNIHSEQSVIADTECKIKNQIDTVTKNFGIMCDAIGENKYAEEILSNINEWKSLMSRTHCSYAKAQGNEKLCEYIKEKYGVEKVVASTPKDSGDYVADGLLGKNFEGVDTILRWIYKKGQDVAVNYDKSDEYVCKVIGYLAQKEGIKITYSKDAELMIPKRKISLKDKLFHSKLAYNVGLRLFPKGSKIRSALKSKL